MARTRKTRPRTRGGSPARKAASGSAAGPRRRPAARPRTAGSARRTAPAAPRRASRAAPARRGGVAKPGPAPPVASAIGVVAHHTDYSSHDVAQVKRFYTEVLGFTDFDHEPRFDYLFVRTGPGSSLGFMPPLPGPPEQWRPPREPSIYFIVADVDRAHRTLVAKGAVFEQAPADMPWGHRTAVLRDPEGRLLCLAQPIRR